MRKLDPKTNRLHRLRKSVRKTEMLMRRLSDGKALNTEEVCFDFTLTILIVRVKFVLLDPGFLSLKNPGGGRGSSVL